MTRAHVADPQIVNKFRAGREEEIRPGVGASHCLYRPVHCLHNPATAADLAAAGDRALAAGGRKVAVVGGGLTGLEAVDRRGGQLVLAAKARLRRDLIGIVNWRIAELERLGVDVRLDVYAEAAEVLAEDPDFVFIATGGIPDFGRVIGS
jgi:NADPH-dependent glutamate synthase beta subunit-like oxidoreductase